MSCAVCGRSWNQKGGLLGKDLRVAIRQETERPLHKLHAVHVMHCKSVMVVVEQQ